jgi:sortase A
VSLGLLLIGLGSLLQGSWIFSKALVAQVLLRRAWSAARSGDARARPWPWADTWPVARLLSPARGVDLIVLEGATGSSIAFGPGHIQGSAAPGSAGNVALAGHRDTHFRFLERLEPGEPLWLELPNGAVQRYQVQSQNVVDEHDTWLLQAPGQWLTLVTCYPFDAPLTGGPLRYVVRASPADEPRVQGSAKDARAPVTERQATAPAQARGAQFGAVSHKPAMGDDR